ncbi:hypothetical protein ACWCQQ_17865 [Streptomyces sp. NPDC002143]
MNIDEATPEDLAVLRAAFGSEFGLTTSEPGFVGWVRHWAAGKQWFDAESAE